MNKYGLRFDFYGLKIIRTFASGLIIQFKKN